MFQKVKLFFLLILTFCCFFFLTSCKDNAKKENSKKNTLILRLAETHPKDYPTTRASQYFADLVEERTNGRIKIQVFHSSQLGEEKEAIEQVQFGGIDFTRVSIAPLTDIVPLLNALQFPFLFQNSDHLWKVLTSDIGDMLLGSLENEDLIGLCWYDSGARCFYNTKKVIKTPKDLAGMKIRVQQSEMMVEMLNLLDVIATPMSYGDVYTGLKIGTIEGAENNWPSYESTKHYEVAKYFTVDEHTRIPEITIASKLVMDKLSAEDQQIIRQAAKDSMSYQIIEWKKEEKRAEQRVRAAGCAITPITDKSAFQEAMKPFFETQPKEIQDLIKRIQELYYE